MDPALIVVLVTLAADIVSKYLNSRKTGQSTEKTAEAVKELQTIAGELRESNHLTSQRLVAVENRVTNLETRHQESGELPWKH